MNPTMTLTDNAANKVRRLREEEGDANLMLRVYVTGGGCSGFSYKFDLANDSNDDDMIIEKDGAKVLIDSISVPYIDGSVIDFIDDLMGQSFQINNPNVTSSCGCGVSFAI